MDKTIHGGDVIVCRVNGTFEHYVIGMVLSGRAGALSLRSVVTTVGRDSALRQAYEERADDNRVWLFDGAAAAYVETVAPAAPAAVHA